MARVKFNVNTEYAYIQNFKVLQSGFQCYHCSGLQSRWDLKDANKFIRHLHEACH